MATFAGKLRMAGIALPALMALGADSILAGRTTDSSPAMLVYDYAGVPADVLLQAEQATQRIFLHAGVAINWRLCRSANSPTALECPDPSPGTPALRLVTRFQVAPNRVHADAMGFTTGDFATVSVEFAQQLEQSGVGRISEILGHLIAHEIGHLLLPGTGHTVHGIMRARWDRTEWELMRQGQLYFAPEQARFIRAALRTRFTRR